MSSRSLLLQLPRDILHSVYSEWLSSWRDLSCLDVGCVGEEDREAWLCSLREVKMRNRLTYRVLSDESMRMWYEWVISRKVLLVERFPLQLRVFANLPTELDFGSYCPSIHSIEIKIGFSVCEDSLDSNMLSVLKERMGLFVRDCIHLKGVRYCDYDNDCEASEISDRDILVHDLMFSVLGAGLNSNTLQSIYIYIQSALTTFIENKLVKFIADHILSLQDCQLNIYGLREDCIDAIMSILHKNRSPLKRLSLIVDRISWQKLLVCLSSVGVHLETLEVDGDYMPTTTDYVKGEFLSTLGRSCPQLRRLRLSSYEMTDEISMSKLYQFYELCPNLISFNCSSSIFIDVNDQDALRYWMWCRKKWFCKGKEIFLLFLQCIFLAIQRSQCKLKLSNQPHFTNLVEQYDEWVLFKSKLSPYLTDLDGEMSESILIEAMKDSPRLEKLTIKLKEDRFTDLGLAAIMEYGYGLRKLWINSHFSRYMGELCSFSDEMISKVIRSCKMLEWLDIPLAGYESLLAVKHHSRLRSVYLHEVRVGRKEMSRLLSVNKREGEEKCVWRRLCHCEISAPGQYTFVYFEKDGRWSLLK